MGPDITGQSNNIVIIELPTGRRINCLTCMDDFSRECMMISVAFGILVISNMFIEVIESDLPVMK